MHAHMHTHAHLHILLPPRIPKCLLCPLLCPHCHLTHWSFVFQTFLFLNCLAAFLKCHHHENWPVAPITLESPTRRGSFSCPTLSDLHHLATYPECLGHAVLSHAGRTCSLAFHPHFPPTVFQPLLTCKSLQNPVAQMISSLPLSPSHPHLTISS